jgi:hypothetical protein
MTLLLNTHSRPIVVLVIASAAHLLIANTSLQQLTELVIDATTLLALPVLSVLLELVTIVYAQLMLMVITNSANCYSCLTKTLSKVVEPMLIGHLNPLNLVVWTTP